MAKNKKTVRKSFSYLQCDDFAAYLSKMAAEGWHFKEWKSGLVFEKGEPESAVYAVEVFINGSRYDMRPGDHTLSFAEYCEAAGWKLIDARAKYCIFKQIREDAVDILTSEERLQNAAKAYTKDLLPQIILAIMWTIDLFRDFCLLSNFIDTAFSGFELHFSVYKVFLLLYIFIKIIWFCVWKQKARKRCVAGETKILCNANEAPWNWVSLILISLLTIGLVLYADIWMIGFILAVVVLSLLVGFLLNKFRPDASTNYAIMIAFAVVLFISAFATVLASVEYSPKSNIPMDLVPILYNESTEEIGALQDTFCVDDTSILGSKQRCHLTYENEDFSYDLYKTEQNWLLDVIWDHKSSKQKNADATDCTALWNSKTAFQNQDCVYYVRCNNAILVLDLGRGMTLTAAQVAAVRSALGLE